MQQKTKKWDEKIKKCREKIKKNGKKIKKNEFTYSFLSISLQVGVDDRRSPRMPLVFSYGI